MGSFLSEATIFLGAAVLAVPLFKKIGLGSVLGYLCAGVVIGPWALGFITEVDAILHFAELGVVLLLFLIGLELQPARLWTLRKAVFGVGGLQLACTTLALAAVGVSLGADLQTSLVAGLALSLSSTAFALQILSEKNQLAAPHGQTAFGILLFQDLAVIPVLAILPLLSPQQSQPAAETPPAWLGFVKVLAVFAIVIFVGRHLLRPIFRAVAGSRSQEIFTAMALLVVLGTALLLERIGLSMALGAFLAGVLLADSEYRHALEGDIEPFKGLLLGLFFIAVGMSVNLGLLAETPFQILGLVALLMAVKAGIMFGLGRLTGLDNGSARALAMVLPQGGEFAFVLFGVAMGATVLDEGLAELLILVVSVSMACTPFLVLVNEKLLARWFRPRTTRAYDAIEEHNPVIIAGYGRFGQIISRVLRAKRIGFTALEASSSQVDFVRKFGSKIYYGDASRLEMLRSAGIEHAQILVIAVDNPKTSLKIAKAVKQHFPHVKIFCRAYDRLHAYKLIEMGITNLQRETYLSSLQMAGDVLQSLGLTFSAAKQAMDTFQQHDEALMYASHQFHDDLETLQTRAKQAAAELEALFDRDAAHT